VFKQATGVTPKAYGAAHRNARLRDNLKSAPTVTAALFEAGFDSSSHFYSGSKAILGMTPRRYKAGGAGTVLKVVVTQCSLGALLVAATHLGIAAILIGDDPEELRRDLHDRFPNAELIGDDAAFQKIVARVTKLVDQPGISHDLPLDVRGTAFQHKVWTALQAISPGQTASYRDIAERIGSPKAVRAVAGACAANPVAVAIPCHRVVRTDGEISGYRWGIARKRTLLALEAKNYRRKT
jgi:AraC family transcriptional regulator of adaptative response/methylated-DNA-[protein]-cysteine methyltransferase